MQRYAASLTINDAQRAVKFLFGVGKFVQNNAPAPVTLLCRQLFGGRKVTRMTTYYELIIDAHRLPVSIFMGLVCSVVYDG